MADQREHIIALARDWIGTPYVHQATTKGAGCDCLGLLRGIWREAFGDEPVRVPAYTRDWAEPGRDERLWRAARTYLREKTVAERAPGDVVLFRMRQGAVAKHLGIISSAPPEPAFIHAYSGHGVVESSLGTAWARRIVACFAFPDMAQHPAMKR